MKLSEILEQLPGADDKKFMRLFPAVIRLMSRRSLSRLDAFNVGGHGSLVEFRSLLVAELNDCVTDDIREYRALEGKRFARLRRMLSGLRIHDLGMEIDPDRKSLLLP
jgi:hypothetical protein